MLKCRHLRVRVRAPRAIVMRRREALALLPVLPLVVDPVHLLVEMQVLQGAKIKEDREEDEEEGQGDDDEREEDEQPPPPPENTRKKHSRKKSKRGRKSR
jgi:hypothetical protein